MLREMLEGGPAAIDAIDIVPVALQCQFKEFSHIFIIVYHKDPGHKRKPIVADSMGQSNVSGLSVHIGANRLKINPAAPGSKRRSLIARSHPAYLYRTAAGESSDAGEEQIGKS